MRRPSSPSSRRRSSPGAAPGPKSFHAQRPNQSAVPAANSGRSFLRWVFIPKHPEEENAGNKFSPSCNKQHPDVAMPEATVTSRSRRGASSASACCAPGAQHSAGSGSAAALPATSTLSISAAAAVPAATSAGALRQQPASVRCEHLHSDSAAASTSPSVLPVLLQQSSQEHVHAATSITTIGRTASAHENAGPTRQGPRGWM
jgi:hypothetical protein